MPAGSGYCHRMSDPALIIENEDGSVERFDEVPAPFAAALLGNHAAHGGVFFVPDCADCQQRWPNGQGWGEAVAR
jgi:hypothetical protein